MKTVTNNAFWRDILDHLPNIVLVFRIDEDEKVHLIFANNEVEKQLGFLPQDYVLASESAGRVNYELEQLINKVADLSHQKEVGNNFECELTSRVGTSLGFNCEFKIFQTSSNRSNLIVLSLISSAQEAATEKTVASGKTSGSNNHFFITESEVMRALMDKVSEYVRQDVNVLVRGEMGAGKRTIARMIGHMSEGGYDVSNYVDLEGKTDKDQRLILFGDSGASADSEKGILNQENDVILLINGFHEITHDNQMKMQGILKERYGKGLRSRIIAISQNSIEDLIESDLFDAGLYYSLDFQPLLVPPLRHRKKDIPIIVEEWLGNVSKALNIEIKEIPQYELNQLMDRDWKGNFTELFDVLRQSLIAMENGVVQFSVPQNKAGQDKDGEPEFSFDGIVSFDEMSRRYFKEVLKKTGGKIYGADGAAKLLHLKPTTLQSKLKKLGIK